MNLFLFHSAYDTAVVCLSFLSWALNNRLIDSLLFPRSIECGFDDGDCKSLNMYLMSVCFYLIGVYSMYTHLLSLSFLGIEFNIGYPGCFVSNPASVGDTVCNQENNVPACKYDGGDCCEISVNHPDLSKQFLGDDAKSCHAGHFYTAKCLYDNGDCDAIREQYPNCPDVEKLILDANGNPIVLGDGKCDATKVSLKDYMNEECGWVFGDCFEFKLQADKRQQQFPQCSLPELFRLGDGICDRGVNNYLNEQCGWDKFDCCDLDVSKIGDGVCDSNGDDIDYLTPECGYEGYDCCDPQTFKFYVNNDNCGDSSFDFATYLPIPKEQLAFNKECAFEGVDCFIPEYPNCQVDVSKYVGDGVCNGGKYNVESCGFDGGDCLGEICQMYSQAEDQRIYHDLIISILFVSFF